MIVSTGNENALIMFIADYGMKEDVIHEHALSGSQEKTLRKFISNAGYNISECYRTCYIKDILDYDGKSVKLKFLAIKKTFDAIAAQGLNYETILTNEILTVRPNIIVPLGDLSLKFISGGYSPLSSYRGSVLPLNPIIQSQITEKTVRVIGTFSPKATWENYTSNVYVQLDYNKIISLKNRTDAIERPGQVWVCRSVEAFRQFLSRQKDFLKKPIADQFITFDIESYLGIPTAISFCFDGKEALSIPLVEQKIDYANSFLLWVEIAKLLNNPAVGKVNQNIKYDWTILERFGFNVTNVIGDTLLGFHLLYPELPKNLGFQTSIYTELPYFKDESNKKEIAYNPKLYTKDTLYLYNAKDALATWQIHRKQIDEIEEAGCTELYNKKIVPLIKIYKEIDERGLLVDQKKKRDLFNKYRSLLEITLLRFVKLVEPIVSFETTNEASACIRSYQKLGQLIYDGLKYPPRYKTEGQRKHFKTDKETLDELIILYPDSNKLKEEGVKILNCIVLIKKLIKILEYIITPLYPDGTLKCTYNLGGTENARSSSSKTIDQIIELDNKGRLVLPMKRLGRSLQTITKHGFEISGELFDAIGDDSIGADLRTMFIPRPGHVFIEGDGSSAESRVVAVLAEDYDMLRAHDVKPKIHARTAGMLFDMDPNIITKDGPSIPGIGMTYYDMGKRTRHAGHLGMTEFRLAQMTHIAIFECRRMLNKFHDNNPKIRGVFHADTYEQVKKTGELRSPFGRIRQFFERFGPGIAKEIYANLPQSTVSDQTKFALIPITIQAPWANFVYEGHDAAMAEVPIGKEKEFVSIFKETYEQPIDFRRCSLSRDFDLTIPCEFTIGENWGEMKDYN